MARTERTEAAPAPASPLSEASTRISLLNPSRWGWLTAEEAGEALGVTAQAIRRAAREGRIAARRPSWLGKWLVPSSEIQRLLAEEADYYGAGNQHRDRLAEAEGVRHG